MYKKYKYVKEYKCVKYIKIIGNNNNNNKIIIITIIIITIIISRRSKGHLYVLNAKGELLQLSVGNWRKTLSLAKVHVNQLISISSKPKLFCYNAITTTDNANNTCGCLSMITS